MSQRAAPLHESPPAPRATSQSETPAADGPALPAVGPHLLTDAPSEGLAPPAVAGADAETTEKPELKKDKKKDRSARREQRGLKPWERYRALTDAYETAQDLLEFGDRKVRFGLVVIGAINLAVFGLAFRAQSVTAVPVEWRPWIMAYLGLYACVLVYGVSHAISALRPRIQPTEGGSEKQTGLHFHEDILRQRYPDFEKSWRDLQIGELTNLLSRQTYSVAHINHAKFSALQRMYSSINVMVTMAGGFLFIAVLVVFGQRAGVLTGDGTRAGGIATAGSGPDFASREYKIMLPPERFVDATGRASDDSLRQGILAYWGIVAAEQWSGVAVRLSVIESQAATGPTRHRLLHFADAGVLTSDADCKDHAPAGAFLYDCKSLVLRSRVSVKPFEPGRGFEIDLASAEPVELTLKSRSASDLRTAQERGIRAVDQVAGAPVRVEYKVEKDMTVGRTTYGQSATVAMTMAQASALFTGRAPNGPGIPLPGSLRELSRLFSAPQIQGAEDRRVAAVPDYAAYEQVYRLPDAIGFPEGYEAPLTMSFWFDMKKELRVVEASWRLQRPKGDSGSTFSPLVVGISEQFLDGIVAVSQRRGFWSSAAQTKKAQALSAAGG